MGGTRGLEDGSLPARPKVVAPIGIWTPSPSHSTMTVIATAGICIISGGQLYHSRGWPSWASVAASAW